MAILAVMVAAFPDNHFAKRAPHLPQLYRRQADGCTTQCGPILSGGNCSTTECICPIVNAAGPTAVTACADCISKVDPYLASNITLTANVCMNCESQCSSTLTAYFASLACNGSLACSCAPFAPLGATTITTCANCVQKFDATDATGLLEFAQECGILPSGAPSSALPSSTASPSSAGAATGSATASASATATASKSAATRIDFDAFGSLVWIALTLKAVVFAFYLV